MDKITYICSTCGSNDISLDATVVWDFSLQEMRVSSMIWDEQAWCYACEDGSDCIEMSGEDK